MRRRSESRMSKEWIETPCLATGCGCTAPIPEQSWFNNVLENSFKNMLQQRPYIGPRYNWCGFAGGAARDLATGPV